jgi:hypothetical protein
VLAGTEADRPVVAVRVRATVGRPGGSAQARWRRLRAAEWAAWVRTLPWRVALILGVGAAGGFLGSLLAPRLGLVLGGLAAGAAGLGLRFRPSPDAKAWRRGWVGERRTARLLDSLERHGWAVLHDLAVPGAGPILTAMIPSAAVAVRSDPNIDRPGCLQSGSVDRYCGHPPGADQPGEGDLIAPLCVNRPGCGGGGR